MYSLYIRHVEGWDCARKHNRQMLNRQALASTSGDENPRNRCTPDCHAIIEYDKLLLKLALMGLRPHKR